MPVFILNIKNYLIYGHYRFWLSGALLFVILGLVWLLVADRHEEKILYTTAKVVRGDIESLVTATGTLQPRDYVDVGAQVSGQLDVLHVDVGSQVTEGDLLAEIDATVYLAKVDGTRASLRNQRAMLLDRQAQLKLADINYTRQKNLQKEDATTQESIESAEANLQSAKAQLEALTAQIEQIESSLRAEEANLKFASIYAPMTGTVVTVTSRQGQTLNTNQMAPTLLRIADLSTMTVQTQVSEADVGKLSIDTPVYFTTLGSEGRRWYSKLSRIEPTPTVLNNVVLYNALFDVPNPNGLLMTQMTTQVFFVTAEAKDVLLIPMSALTFNSRGGPQGEKGEQADGAVGIAGKKNTKNAESNKFSPRRTSDAEKKSRAPKNITGAAESRYQQEREASVKILNTKGKVEERQVKVGVTNRVQAEIISGLNEAEDVIIGIQQPGQQSTKDVGRWGQPRMMR